MNRRSLLKVTLGSATALSSLPCKSLVEAGTVAWQTAGESVPFDGDGLYLFPHWGTPRLYQVSRNNNELLFSYPGQQTILWRQSLTGMPPLFSGKINPA